MDSFKESRERTAWVSSITMAMSLFLGPAIGAFINRFGCRLATIIGCLSCSLALVLGSLAPNIMVLYLAFSVLFGLGTSFTYVFLASYCDSLFQQEEIHRSWVRNSRSRPGNNDLRSCFTSVSGRFDWRNTFLIFAGVLALSSLTGLFQDRNDQKTDNFIDQKQEEFHEIRLQFICVEEPEICGAVGYGGSY
ncbi:hypothetical protein OS493_021664 [Desmophyllum pertusum]|uniref:Major facilitator superfamily (MFS) profile domain-containing protein n=1 Tax=Desmophyllum pertusum TaxID=174260 RepID=A0A9W9YB49_9CNID|nr:hypothetical protein OS493_021664 [Desmophyllum pertusum]